MKIRDVWIALLALTLCLACIPLKSTPYECVTVDPRSGAEAIPKSSTAIPIVSTSPTPSATPEMSACERENVSLKIETDSWRERYYETVCECTDESL